MDRARVDAIVDQYDANPASLLAILQDIQSEARYLPRPLLERVADRLELPVAHLYRMATFFDSFHLEPRGEHICTVCMGTACHVRGSKRLVEQLERDLHIQSGQTTPDFEFTIEEVNCVGACALGPLVIIDDEYHGNMTSDRVSKTIKKLRKGGAR